MEWSDCHVLLANTSTKTKILNTAMRVYSLQERGGGMTMERLANQPDTGSVKSVAILLAVVHVASSQTHRTSK